MDGLSFSRDGEPGRYIANFADLQRICASIEPLRAADWAVPDKRWQRLCKPLHSLGLLEKQISRIAAVQRTELPDLSPRAVFVFCADNGVVAEGVTQAGQEVTAQVMHNMLAGQSCVCFFARACTCDVWTVNLGARDFPGLQLGSSPNSAESGVRDQTHGQFQQTALNGQSGQSGQRARLIEAVVRPGGTENFAVRPAMSEADMFRALSVGFELACQAAEQGYRVLIGGEMGIGNTTTSTAIICARLGLDPREMTGRGAGLSDRGLANKVRVIEQALRHYREAIADATDCLRHLGGFDLAALTGFYLGAAVSKVPVILDGLISLAAATLACELAGPAREYLIAAHWPHEPAGQAALRHLDLSPLLRAELAIGEGAGGVAILPQLDMAAQVLANLATFDQGGVEPYRDFLQQPEDTL